MRHFAFMRDSDQERLFFRLPEDFTLADDPALLGAALGGTLYCPATRPELAGDIVRRSAEGLLSVAVCLEDAVADADLEAAERNAVAQLRHLADAPQLPMIFVRVRAAAQIPMLLEGLGDATGVLAGFVIPKFTEDHGAQFLDEVADAATSLPHPIYVMPVLEAREVMFAESRRDALLGIRGLLDKYRQFVPAVRIGATDLSAAYGLRRPRELSVWDVRVIADAIADFVNILGRADGGFTITGAVWEYYSQTERLFKPQLRETPFAEHKERRLRAELIAADLDGLIRELALDRANGLLGKTVIHPSHIAAVHALSVVSHEEYSDAQQVLDTGAGGGAAASSYNNKMNESKPHTAWAGRTMLRARAFGVANEGVSYVDLLAACVNQ